MAAKTKFSKLQMTYLGGTLCPPHATAYDMPKGSYTPCPPTETLGEEEAVECDCCTVYAMRAVGAL
jgi:hypothetical protein